MRKYAFVTIVLLFFITPVIAQTTVIIPVAADNTIYQTPSGNSNALGQNIFSGTNGGGSPRRGLIKFDPGAAIPAGATITAVTLTLNCNNTRTIADNVSLHTLTSDWGEGTSDAGGTGDGVGVAATTNDATWLTRFFPSIPWTTAGGDFNSTASASTSINATGFFTWSTASMVSDVQSWLNNPAANYGWILLCNESTIATARRFASRQNTVMANRPSLSITYTVTVMPVTLTYFKVRLSNPGVLLQWETAKEINNHYFEILHSRDGILYSPVGRVDSYGASTTKQVYRFAHNIHIPGNHFYKLLQSDLDGRQTHSTIEKIYIPETAGAIKVIPQPVLNEFKIYTTMHLQNAEYKIFNQFGSVVQSGIIGNNNYNAVSLIPGTYYLCVYEDKKLVSRVTFIKMNPR